MRLIPLALAITATLALTSSALALDLPAICKSPGMAMPMAQNAMPMAPMDKAHQDLMQGMDTMSAQMNEGMMASDLDVAFVCGMLPHHQGAIDMARAELAHGKDPFARQLAQSIIDAQEKEIAAMLDWLAKQGK
jgi:uncharacterized protein (DUF305 family)